MNASRNFSISAFVHISMKFKYFAKQFILTEPPDHVLKLVFDMFEAFSGAMHCGVISRKLLIKSPNQHILSISKMNRVLQ